ncbi:MAG: hypothetical protein CMC99_04715 [Flavobacteriales bacterium]|nr:hypothetical protein [Flavobacteriales bacterium]
MHYGQTKLSTHVFARYRLSSMFAVRAQLGTVYLEDYDNLSANAARRTRNAHFRNYVNELSLRGEINLFSQPMITRYTSKLRVGVNTYATLGVTGFVHNPQAQLDRDAAEYHYAQGNITTNPALLDYDRWYDLRDVGTEKLTYGSVALGFPLGLGASFMVNYKLRVGIEFVWNLTLTDYLDDVSFTWADPEGLDDIGLILSNPSSAVVAESAGVDNPEAWLTSFEHNATWDSPRGNPDRNDTYGTLQITASKVVMGSSNFRRNNYNSKRRTVKRRPNKPGSSRMGRGRAKF